MFISINMNHWRAVKAWLDAHGGQATLDMATHELDVRARNRYYRLYPQFLAEADGRMSHVAALTPQATSFIGWRPYRPVQCRLSSDKRVFKQALRAAGLRTPAHWAQAEDAQADFVLKRSAGSFGYQLHGPFRAGEPLPPLPDAPGQRGSLFAEQFIHGTNLKAWFWDGRPVHLQSHPYAVVEGDGRHTVQQLVEARLRDAGRQWATHKERDVVLGCLAYQRLVPSSVLGAGQSAWLDYRYGRGLVAPAVTEAEDNAWPRLAPALKAQVQAVGEHLAAEIRRDSPAPLLFAVDGVVDADGAVWWLELNSNPICPPNAYCAMFATLFNTPAKAPPHAYARAARPAPNRPQPRASTPARAETA